MQYSIVQYILEDVKGLGSPHYIYSIVYYILYIKFIVGNYSPGYVLHQMYPPGCQVYCTKNWTKGYRFLVCKGGRWVPPKHLPPPPASRGTPHCFIQLKTKQELFSKINSTRKQFQYYYGIASNYAMLCSIVLYSIYQRMSKVLAHHTIYSIISIFYTIYKACGSYSFILLLTLNYIL